MALGMRPPCKRKVLLPRPRQIRIDGRLGCRVALEVLLAIAFAVFRWVVAECTGADPRRIDGFDDSQLQSCGSHVGPAGTTGPPSITVIAFCFEARIYAHSMDWSTRLPSLSTLATRASSARRSRPSVASSAACPTYTRALAVSGYRAVTVRLLSAVRVICRIFGGLIHYVLVLFCCL